MDWKQKHANDCDAAIGHELVQGVIAEAMTNLRTDSALTMGGGLAKYALTKVATYAAQVARAQALGFDPNLLLVNDDEIAEHRLKLIQLAVKHNKPIIEIR